MIFEALAGILFAVLQAIVGAMLALVPGPPDWALEGAAKISQIVGYAYAVDAWIPVGLMLTIVGGVLAAYAVSVVIGAVRMIVSYFTLGGGTT